MADLAGRHALVTGGSRGIGRAVAAALTQAGATVTVLGRDHATLAEAVARGAASAFVVGDVTDAAAVGAGIARAAAHHGPVDILIANAGGAESAPFAKADPEQFHRMFELNVMGSIHAIRAVLDGMVARKFGRIVAVASTAGLKGYAYVSAYCAAKHAVVGLVRALALETATTGVTVNAVCPGYTDTDMVRESAARIAAKTGRPAEEAVAAMVRNNPLGRLITPDEVAEAVVFLCSPAAAAITGTALTVAGGEI
ncbi:MAG: SDR family oxidoreductase [Hyphomicrobiales bacterium]|nr:SDR family oxidoreductase [Hyphomicrobiales bacterium]MBV9428909.1 SDR family oxidoreductase [Bradyrhizobiaceae bacterium]